MITSVAPVARRAVRRCLASPSSRGSPRASGSRGAAWSCVSSPTTLTPLVGGRASRAESADRHDLRVPMSTTGGASPFGPKITPITASNADRPAMLSTPAVNHAIV